jgi:hypothetical protein
MFVVILRRIDFNPQCWFAFDQCNLIMLLDCSSLFLMLRNPHFLVSRWVAV